MGVRTERELRASFLNQPLMPYIGATLYEISPGKACIEVTYEKNITQQHGLFHGGGEHALSKLDDSGIVYVGAEVNSGDILVGSDWISQPLTMISAYSKKPA